MMARASPTSWRALVAGDQIVQANKEALEGCRKAAAKARNPVRCTVRISQGSRKQAKTDLLAKF